MKKTMHIVKNTKNRGATVIEFALVAFIFFLIMWGLLEFARDYYVRNTTQYLTRCMTREAVVLKPSQYALAKQNCLFQTSSGIYTWPFYDLAPDNLTNKFVITYYMKDGTTAITKPNSGYDDQLNLCLTSGEEDHCVTYVETSVAQGTTLTEFGMLRSWLGSPGSIAEPSSAVKMPAESMGYTP